MYDEYDSLMLERLLILYPPPDNCTPDDIDDLIRDTDDLGIPFPVDYGARAVELGFIIEPQTNY